MLESIFSTNGSPAAINQYFSRVDVKYFAKLSLYESHLLLADMVMVSPSTSSYISRSGSNYSANLKTYRLYHLFGRNFWICIPVFLAIPGIIGEYQC
jgi:hypothetical protein